MAGGGKHTDTGIVTTRSIGETWVKKDKREERKDDKRREEKKGREDKRREDKKRDKKKDRY